MFKTKLGRYIAASVTTMLIAAGFTVASPAVAADNVIQLKAVIVTPSDITTPGVWDENLFKKNIAVASDYWSVMSNNKYSFALNGTIDKLKTSATTKDSPTVFADKVKKEIGYTDGPYKGLLILSTSPRILSEAGNQVTASSFDNGTYNGGFTVYGNQMLNEANRQKILTHEFGHWFRIGHTNRLACSDGNIDTPVMVSGRTSTYQNPSCVSVEYDDTNDIMSNAASHGAVNTYSAQKAGFVKPTDILPVTLGEDTEYTLRPWGDRASNENKSLKIVDPTNSEAYYVELRQSVGLDANEAVGIKSGVRFVKSDLISTRSIVLSPVAGSQSTDVNTKLTWDTGSIFLNANKTFAVKIVNVSPGSAKVIVSRVTPQTAETWKKNHSVTKSVITANIADSDQNIPYYSKTVPINIAGLDATGKPLTGSVTVYSGSTLVGSAQLDAAGKTVVQTYKLAAVGTRTYNIIHSDANVSPVSVNHVVTKSVITSSLTASKNSIQAKEPVTLNSVFKTVGWNPTGTVELLQNGIVVQKKTLASADAGKVSFIVDGLTSSNTFEVRKAGSANQSDSVSNKTVVDVVFDTKPKTLKSAFSKDVFVKNTHAPVLTVTGYNDKNQVFGNGTFKVLRANGTVAATGTMVNGQGKVTFSNNINAGTWVYKVVLDANTTVTTTSQFVVKAK